MTGLKFAEHPHRRLNILTGEWVLVSPHRTRRPWQGRVERAGCVELPRYDAGCYLCPGNARADGHNNPEYQNTFVFDNDFAALLQNTPVESYAEGKLLYAETEPGICRVVCFSPRHDLTLAEMSTAEINKVVELWCEEYKKLGEQPDISYVQIFENKGSLMGCSNPHPHGQIWAQRTIPGEPVREIARMRAHYESKERPLLIDYVELEQELAERVVCANESFVALVPFWATWPFEVMVLPRRQVASLLHLELQEKMDMAGIIREVTVRFDNLFETSFPYSAGIHQAPTDGKAYPECTLHMHFYPPLLRSADVKKFMVGYEMLAGPQRDVSPETSAKWLRKQSAEHYRRTRGGDDN